VLQLPVRGEEGVARGALLDESAAEAHRGGEVHPDALPDATHARMSVEAAISGGREVDREPFSVLREEREPVRKARLHGETSMSPPHTTAERASRSKMAEGAVRFNSTTNAENLGSSARSTYAGPITSSRPPIRQVKP
jgi:hypothetical protein